MCWREGGRRRHREKEIWFPKLPWGFEDPLQIPRGSSSSSRSATATTHKINPSFVEGLRLQGNCE